MPQKISLSDMITWHKKVTLNDMLKCYKMYIIWHIKMAEKVH